MNIVLTAVFGFGPEAWKVVPAKQQSQNLFFLSACFQPVIPSTVVQIRQSTEVQFLAEIFICINNFEILY